MTLSWGFLKSQIYALPDFDEEDPLAGLLSEDEDGGTKKPIKKKTPKMTQREDEPIQKSKPEPAKQENPAKDDISRSEGIKVKG